MGQRPTKYSDVALSVEGNDLVVRPDASWLKDPARKYPVVIDPTITPGQGLTTNAFGYVDSDYPNTHLSQCHLVTSVCFGNYNAALTHQALVYLRYDLSPIKGKVINSAQLKLDLPQCTNLPVQIGVRRLSSAFDAASVTWSTRPEAGPEGVLPTVSAVGTLLADVTFLVSRTASDQPGYTNYGFVVSMDTSVGECDLNVMGSTYLEITYSDVVTNRPPTNFPEPGAPVIAPLTGATVSAPVALTATAFDPDGDQISYWYAACRKPCGTSDPSMQSGWTTATSKILTPTPQVGENWEWWVFFTDNINPYAYSAAQSFTIGNSGIPPQENWAWGSDPDYSAISSDNQANAGVNTGTKRFVYEATDANVASAGPPLAMTRTYNSGDTTVGVFGKGWSSILDANVQWDPQTNDLLFRLSDGRREFHPATPGLIQYRAQPGIWSQANREWTAPLASNTFSLREKSGALWRFRPDGRISSYLDRNGRGIDVEYDASNKPVRLISRGFSSQRSLNIAISLGQVTVTDGVNPAWNYYLTGTQLTKVCDPRNNAITGSCITYAYDASDRMVSATKPRGNKDFEVSYYADSTVQWRKDGMGNQWSYAYNTATRVATTTDPEGRVTTEQYNALTQLISRTEPGDANIASQTTTFVYDSNGFLTRKTSPLGSWEYVNDFHGNQIEVKDPTGATSYFQYDSRDLLIDFRDARSSSNADTTYRWTYGYDANGNRVRETNPFGWSRTWMYSSLNTQLSGLLTQETDWNGSVTTYAYSWMGDVVNITYPGVSGDNVTYTYDALGRKTSETGRVAAPGITYTYDALNAPLTITEPPVTNAVTGVVRRKQITLTYDANHLKSTESVADIGGSATPDPTRVTTWSYDNNDRQISETDPIGRITSKSFSPAGTLATETNGLGKVTRIAYNARDLPKTITAVGFTDPVNGIGPVDRVLGQIGYDGAGRPISKTDGNGNIHTFTYDAVGRQLTETAVNYADRTGAVRNILLEETTYDKIGNVLLRRRGNTGVASQLLSMTYVYDNLGRLVAENNGSQPRINAYVLDRNGNITTSRRETTGSVVLAQTDSTYDARNRVLTVTEKMATAAEDRTTTSTYTKWGTVATLTNPRGAVTTFTYDALGQLSTSTAPSVSHEDVGGTAVAAAAVTKTGYNTFGQVTQNVDARGAVTTTAYNAAGQRTGVTHPACASGCSSATASEAWSYDLAGNISSHTNRRGKVTNYTYDSTNRLVRTLLPLVAGVTGQATQSIAYDVNGNVTKTTNEIGAVTYFTYTQLNQVRTAQVVDRFPSVTSGTTTFDYNDLGQTYWASDPLGFVTTFEYLQTGEQTKRTDPASAVWTDEYDALGRRVKSTTADNISTGFAYNRASEVTGVTTALGNATYAATVSTSYDKAGNATAVTDRRGNTTSYQYDLMIRMTQVTTPNGASPILTKYGYDKNSNMTRVTDGRNNITTYTYNAWNLLTSTVEPSTTAHPAVANRTFGNTYDSGGLPVGSTKPGVNISRTFNELGFLTSETSSGTGLTTVTKTKGVDFGGRVTSLNGQSFTYDDRGNLLTSGGTGNNAKYTYDLNARMTGRSDGANYATNSFVTFGYNNRGNVTTLNDPATGTQSSTYWAGGRLASTCSATFACQMISQDYAGRAAENRTYIGSTITNTSVYTYDKNNNLTGRAITAAGNSQAGNHTYAYDQSNRLTNWTSPGGSVNYTWDAAGNRLTEGTSTFTYDQRNRMLTAPGQTFTWTARGTLASKTGPTATYTTDAADRLISAALTAGTVSYSYDGFDRLASRTQGAATASFVYAGFERDPVQQIQTGADVKFARDPNGAIISSTTAAGSSLLSRDVHSDGASWYNGSTGASTNTRVFSPFGSMIGSTGAAGANLTVAGFQGQYTDPLTGDVLMGARWYAPSLGSFRTRDTYGGQAIDPISRNRYLYANANPVTFTDKAGRFVNLSLDSYDYPDEVYDTLPPTVVAPQVEAIPVPIAPEPPPAPTPAPEAPAAPPPAAAPVPTAATCDNACQAAYYQQTGNILDDVAVSDKPATFAEVVPTADGGEAIVVVAPTGVAVSTETGTVRTGNLSQTPNEAAAAAVIEAVATGSTSTSELLIAAGETTVPTSAVSVNVVVDEGVRATHGSMEQVAAGVELYGGAAEPAGGVQLQVATNSVGCPGEEEPEILQAPCRGGSRVLYPGCCENINMTTKNDNFCTSTNPIKAFAPSCFEQNNFRDPNGVFTLAALVIGMFLINAGPAAALSYATQYYGIYFFGKASMEQFLGGIVSQAINDAFSGKVSSPAEYGYSGTFNVLGASNWMLGDSDVVGMIGYTYAARGFEILSKGHKAVMAARAKK